MNKFWLLFKTLFKISFRSNSISKLSKSGKVGIAIAFVYLGLMFGFMIVMSVLSLGGVFVGEGLTQQFIALMLGIDQIVLIVFGVALIIGTLYLANDYDLLSTFPVSNTVVFWAKLAKVYVVLAGISLYICLVSGITLATITSMGILYYFMLLVCALLAPILSICIATLLIIGIMPVLNALRKYKIVLSLIGLALICVALYFYFQLFSTDFFAFDEESAITLSTYAISVINGICNFVFFDFAMGGLILGQSILINLLIVLAVSIGLIVINTLLAKFTIKKAIDRLHEQTDELTVSRLTDSVDRKNVLLKREWLSIVRFPSLLFYCSVSIFLPPILLSFISSSGNTFPLVGNDMFASLTVFAIIIFMGESLQFFGLSSFTREGSSFELLKTLPVSMKEISNTKVKVALFSTIITIVACLVVGIIVFNLQWYYVALIGLSSVLFSVGVAYLTVLLDAKHPRLEWDNIYNALQNNPNSIKLMGISALLLLAMAGVALLCLFVIPMSMLLMNVIIWGFIFALSLVFAVTLKNRYNKYIELYLNKIE